MHDSLCVYSDINGVIEELGLPHDLEEWRLLIDA
jgi:hypothetical protein